VYYIVNHRKAGNSRPSAGGAVLDEKETL